MSTPPKLPVPPLEQILREKCRRDFAYFTDSHCYLLSETAGPTAGWVPFHLWPAQEGVARAFQDERLVIALKARQLGLTWLALALALWHVLLHPIATVLVFSKRDDEAIDLLGRLKRMNNRLADWLKAGERNVVKSNDHEWEISNGSRILCFPTTAGDSYTGSLAIVDEADLIPDLDNLMRAVKPTIDGGGKMLLISRADKSRPESSFKKMFRAAAAGESDWHPIFLPWNARPDRTEAWYEAQKRDSLARTGSLDDLCEQYPASDAEALAPRSLDKRLPHQWLTQCYRPQRSLDKLTPGAPAIPGLHIYRLPDAARTYVVGNDPAQGNPTSDPSALTVMDTDSGEEVASLSGRYEPATFAGHCDRVSMYYNRCAVLVERNNHGHAVILWLRDNTTVKLLKGHDGNVGWHTTTKSKSMLYDGLGEQLRDQELIIHRLDTFSELASVEGATLKAPEGQHDDLAVSYALAAMGKVLSSQRYDIHDIMDQIIKSKNTRPGDYGPHEQLPETPLGGVTFSKTYGEFAVYTNVGSSKVWHLVTADKGEALAKWAEMFPGPAT